MDEKNFTIGDKVIVHREDLVEYQLWDATVIDEIGIYHYLVEFADGKTSFTRVVHLNDLEHIGEVKNENNQ